MSKTRAALWGLLAAAWTATAAAADSQGAPVVTVTGGQGGAGLSLESRISKLERVVEGQALADLLLRIQRLQADMQQLRGELEVQANDIKGIKQRQRDLYLDIDRRLHQLEVSVAAAATAPAASPAMPGSAPGMTPSLPPSTGVPVAGTAPGVGAPPPAPEQEQAAYQKAFDLLKGGHYDDAITAFRDLLTAYPGGKLADNAQYWLGEAHFAARRFREAAEEFGRVLRVYPQSPKVPDAMLKLGFSYYELGEWAKARDTLERLASRYPRSTAAQLADRRLEKMKSEGH